MTKVKRLVRTFRPAEYDLSIDINEQTDTFKGLVVIKGTVPDENDSGIISLHAKSLDIDSIHINGRTAKWTLSGDELNITLPKNVISENPNLIITIKYHGLITPAMHGLYPANFIHQGVQKKLYATQFESHHAREMFPCVDEPQAKAKFNVTVTTQPDITVLSNQPIKTQRQENGRLVTTFKTTPIMSTYLLAIVAGELIKKTGTTKNGVTVNVYATPVHTPNSLDFALENAINLIDFYDDYFGVPYPLEKSDQVALPDFSSGAMENWGLVTYRESALLANEKADIDSKQQIAKVIAHELSHQWFGNLVTMEWWNDLWLNESFANMIEYLAVDSLHPHWNIWHDFSCMEVPYALARDSLDGVQAVQSEVNHPDEISALFDGAIVYAKGGHLLYMVKNLIGESAFREGLQNYFEKYAYQNTVGNHLWEELSLASNQDITSLMNRWIRQPGFPVVHARVEDGQIIMKQEQFFIGDHKKTQQLWPIPLDSTHKNAPMVMEEQEITFPLEDLDELFILNKQNASHFITLYSPELRQKILEAFAANKLDDNYKIQFLNEAMLLANGGLIEPAMLLDILEPFKDEENEQVWGIIASLLVSFRKFVRDDAAAEQNLKKLTGKLAQSQYQRLGLTRVPGESENDSKLRGTILAMMLYAEDQTVIEKASQVTQSAKIKNMDAETRVPLLSAVIKNEKDGRLFNELLNTYPKESDPQLKDDILSALTATIDITKITLLLDKISDKQFNRPQDAIYWFVRLLRNSAGTALTWQWLQDNWAWVDTTFKGDKSYDDFARLAVTGLYTRKQLNEYTEFFHELKEDPALTRVISLGVKDLEAKVKQIEDHRTTVKEKLETILAVDS